MVIFFATSRKLKNYRLKLNFSPISNSQIHEWLLRTDLVVAPARCEPFGLLLVEAMNYGVPYIVSKTGGMPEIVDNEVNGIVRDQPNPELLAKEIIRLLSNPGLLESMLTKVRQSVKSKFYWDIAKNQILCKPCVLNLREIVHMLLKFYVGEFNL